MGSDAPPSSSSYIDTSALLADDFSPTAHANALLLKTVAPTDDSIDLSTPLSRVLFDIQEIDTRIHTLSTASALPLLEHTRGQTEAAVTVIEDVGAKVAALTEGYERLEKDVVGRWKEADEVKTVVMRLWETVKLGQSVGRFLQLARQLEGEMSELEMPMKGGTFTATSNTPATKLPHRALPAAAQTLAAIKTLLTATEPGEDGEHLGSISLVKDLQSHVLFPAQSALQSRGQQIIREFSQSYSLTTTPPPPLQAPAATSTASSSGTASSSTTPSTYAQITESKARTTSAVRALYTLDPSLLLASLQNYLKTALTSSLAAFGRALTNLSTLDRTLLEISARCQNIVALEALLSTIFLPPPSFPPPPPAASNSSPAPAPATSKSTKIPASTPLLQSLDTPSLPSYFWRTLASGLSPRVADLVSKGGPTTRSLMANKEALRERVRECVLRGSRPLSPTTMSTTMMGGEKGGMMGKKDEGRWEREAAVMVGSVVGALGR